MSTRWPPPQFRGRLLDLPFFFWSFLPLTLRIRFRVSRSSWIEANRSFQCFGLSLWCLLRQFLAPYACCSISNSPAHLSCSSTSSSSYCRLQAKPNQ